MTNNGLHPVSEEQQHIINHVLNGHNVVVDACAGSGKSTTILSMALALPPDKQVLQITYNSELRKDVKHQIEKLCISNLKVHTFHSLAVRYYLASSHTDTGIRKILFDNIPPREPIPHFHIIVLDEAQDITFLYFQLMVKLSKDMGQPFQLMVLGDFMQGLYQFKGADIRFLTQCSRLWASHPLLHTHIFHHETLKTSYRITNQMASFVNDVMLGNKRLHACKEGTPVIYIRNTRKNMENIVIYQIQQLINAGECPSSIFVLGASVKGVRSNIRKLENVLVESGIPCHVPMFETDKIDERVMHGKVVFSTFHSVKGRQRKHVFVTGFDNNYFHLYASNLPKTQCPNTLYVACTRATHQLYVLENDQYPTDRPLEFLKMNHYDMRKQPYLQFRGTPRTVFYEKVDSLANSAETISYHDVTPTDLIKFVPENVIEEISPLLDKIFVSETPDLSVDDEISIPNMIETRKGFFEDVSDINGIAIPSMYYDHVAKYMEENDTSSHRQTGAKILQSIIRDCMADTRDNDYTYLKKIIREIPQQCVNTRDYLYLSNVFIAAKEKLYFKLKQIEMGDYEWLSTSIVQECLQRMDKTIGIECKTQSPLIEHQIIHYDMAEENRKIHEILFSHFPDTKKQFRFSARTDLITHKCIWEIKCTSTLTIEHKLQVIIYDWLWKILHDTREMKNPLKKYQRHAGKSKKMKIINIKSGEILRLDASFEELTQIVVALLKGKYTEHAEKTDEELLHDCMTFIHNYTPTNP
jgi:hypothetical protein